jgi:uncharacterized protein (TIGR00251 family)
MGLLKVRVKPRSSRRGILDCQEGVWQVALTSPPEGGKANRELIQLVAKALRIAPSSLSLSSGEKSRIKCLDILDLETEEIERRLRGA